jgi:hypothetical protein
MKTMKTIISVTSVLAALALITLPAKASTYLGTGTANGGGAADGGAFSSVVVNNDASTITFTINSTLPMATWIFYSIQIQHIGQGGGDISLLNPWGEHMGISTGENALINTYGTGATAMTWNGTIWGTPVGASWIGGNPTASATMTVPLSSLGLSLGDSFYFDVVSSYASPGGQSAYGALDSVSGFPAETDSSWTPWNGPVTPNYYDSATDAGGTTFGTAASLYVVAVPEPTTLALLSGGVIFLLVQRRRVPGNRAA